MITFATTTCKGNLIYCGNSSVGRALASQAEGREFESRLPLKVQRHTGVIFFHLVYIPALELAAQIIDKVRGNYPCDSTGSSPAYRSMTLHLTRQIPSLKL